MIINSKKMSTKRYLLIGLIVMLATILVPCQSYAAKLDNPWRIAIVKGQYKGRDFLTIEPLISLLTKEGFNLKTITEDELLSSTVLNTDNFDCLMLTYSPGFPMAAKENLLGFLKAGGDLVLMGGALAYLQFDEYRVELKIFSDYEPYQLKDIVKVATAPGQDMFTKNLQIKGMFSGTSAIGFQYPNQSMFIPLLSAQDKFDRTRGWAGGILINYAGLYSNSNWLLFGISQLQFYESSNFAGFLAEMLKKMHCRNLVQMAIEKDKKWKAEKPAKLKTPVPKSFIRLSDDSKHLVYPDGQRFFMIGGNYIGSLDRKFHKPDEFYNRYLEEDFRKAYEAGLNCLRIYGGSDLFNDPSKLEALKELARKYGIYLLIVIDDHPTSHMSKPAMIEYSRYIARLFKDEPMVLGYDLGNEPYFWKLGKICDDYGVSLVEKFPTQGYKEYHEWANLLLGYYSVFPGVKGPPPVNDKYNKVFNSVNSIYETWIKWNIDAIREIDPHHLITVGYNTYYACYPANAQLDFISNHAYISPASYKEVTLMPTTLDRLAKVWPDKPISFGEFGYSTGDIITAEQRISFHQAGIWEFLNYLYALANNYEGCFKWELNDWPIPNLPRQAPWLRQKNYPPNEDKMERYYEVRGWGMFYYDGTPAGRPKPIVYAIRFLRKYIDEAGLDGEIEIRPRDTSLKIMYEFKGKNALFIGDIDYKGKGIEFSAKQPTNMMLRWDDKKLTIMSTSDATVKLEPAGFVPSLTLGSIKIDGKYASTETKQEQLILELLEGETLILIR